MQHLEITERSVRIGIQRRYGHESRQTQAGCGRHRVGQFVQVPAFDAAAALWREAIEAAPDSPDPPRRRSPEGAALAAPLLLGGRRRAGALVTAANRRTPVTATAKLVKSAAPRRAVARYV